MYSKPPLESFTKVCSLAKAKPSEGTPQGPVDRGLAAAYFGANPVASALNLPQERDSPENHPYSNPALFPLPSKPDISTWQRLGHFYLALTEQKYCLVWSVAGGVSNETASMLPAFQGRANR